MVLGPIKLMSLAVNSAEKLWFAKMVNGDQVVVYQCNKMFD